MRFKEYDGIRWYNNGKDHYQSYNYGQLHRYIWEKHNGTKIPEGYIIHHKNENKEDNEPINLILMTHGEHSRLHHTGHKHSEESKQKMSESSKGQVAWNKGLDKNDPRVQKNIANNPCFQKIRPPELVEAIRNGLRQKDMVAKFGYSTNLYKTIKRELKEQGIPIKVNETTTSRKGFIMSDEQKKKISQTKKGISSSKGYYIKKEVN